MKSASIKRFWEIDFLRGIAIIMMVIFHIIFDLAFFKVYDIDYRSGGLFYFNVSIPLLFLLLVGISLTLKYNKLKILWPRKNYIIIRSFIERSLVIFTGGVLISLITWMLLDEGVIHFGILHLIGLSIVLSIPLVKSRWFNLGLGISFIIVGVLIDTIRIDGYYLLWLGLKPSFYYSLDYFPVLPWFGVVLIGIFFGNSFYSNYNRSFSFPDEVQNIFIKKINYLGKHSLIIYFLHQPLIIIVLIISGIIDYSLIFSTF